MAKTIKFNLICDDKPIRTIMDLQENFSIEDVLSYYKNGLLSRWLEVRGYNKELKKVSSIKTEDTLGVIKELIKIFGVSADEKKIEEGVYMIEFLDEHKELCTLYEKNKFKVQSIIDDYQAGYIQLVEGILHNPSDVARIKANIEEMASNYKWVLDLNHRELFWTLYDKSVLAVMCLLMNEKTRDYFLPVEIRDLADEKENNNGNKSLFENVYKTNSILGLSNYAKAASESSSSNTSSTAKIYDIQDNADKRNMYNAICKLLKSADFSEKLGDNLKTVAGETAGYWTDLEPKGKKYMIISIGAGDFVRSAGVQGGDLSSVDVNESFVIVDGVDYKSNSNSRKLLYMEV
ncbi:hypothetical protein SAMN04487884_1497 [Butyrivibrio fibrisolvens]|uniref:Uncharacterized protein n=1 Tax=Butyrivibrio fibrisolvens TaxID=831 RepID=A0A1H9X8N5_BUTFI|nr:hypothetical protein [Butyrivibrio fibrisolvens]SES42558.1 hypothetical protein SAMN04487884_1497 [Butyrivibrio fibrisolvens]